MIVSGTGHVAFIGIGNMGWPMAARLVGAKFDIVALIDAWAAKAVRPTVYKK